MAWAGAGRKFWGWCGGGGERAAVGVHVVDEDVVRAEVADVEEAAGGIEGCAVGIGLGLSTGVDAGAVMGNNRTGVVESAVGSNGKRGDTGAVVVGCDEEMAGGMDGEMRWVLSTGGLLIEEGEVSGGGIDDEGVDGAGIIFER